MPHFRVAKRSFNLLIAVGGLSFEAVAGWWSFVLGILKEFTGGDCGDTFSFGFKTRFYLLFVRDDKGLRSNISFHFAIVAHDSLFEISLFVILQL